MKNMPRVHIILIISLALFSIILFSNTVKNPFIWDDEALIVENAFIKSLKSIPVLFTPAYWNYYHPGGRGQYRPVRTVTFALDYSLWKSNVFGYHITNIILHALNTIMVYLLVLYIGMYSGEDRILPVVPFLAALFFAAHPMHVESVAWIKNRSDLLALSFFLASFIFFIRHLHNRNLKIYIAGIFFYILSLFSKEMGFALPFMLVIYVLLFVKKEEIRGGLAKILPFFVVMGFYLLFKLTALGTLISEENVSNIAGYQHVFLIIKTVGWYLRLLLDCFSFNAERILLTPQSFLEPSVLLSLLSIAILAIFARTLYMRSKTLSLFGLLWIFITLLPATNIILISGRPLAEQRLYIPSVGFCLLLASGVCTLLRVESKGPIKRVSRTLIFSFVAALTFAYSIATFDRNLDWRDPITFWSKTIKASPHSSRAYYNLANQYLITGRSRIAREFYAKTINAIPKSDRNARGEQIKAPDYRQKEAIRLYEKALELGPVTPKVYYNLGKEYTEAGDYQKAKEFYEKALELEPDKADAYNNLGVVYMAQGDREKALASYKRAISLRPSYFKGYVNLGLAYYEAGKRGEAIQMYKKALEVNPYYAEAYNNLGVAYQAEGDIEKALSAYDRALEIDPGYADVYYNKGVLYTTNNMADRSIFMFNKTIELDKSHVDAYYNLGLIYKRFGRNLLAIETLKKSIELMPRPDACDVLGLAYMDIGKIDEAIDAFKKVLELDPEFQRTYGYLGQAYLRKGDMDSAMEYFKKAKEHGLEDPKIDILLKSIKPGQEPIN